MSHHGVLAGRQLRNEYATRALHCWAKCTIIRVNIFVLVEFRIIPWGDIGPSDIFG